MVQRPIGTDTQNRIIRIQVRRYEIVRIIFIKRTVARCCKKSQRQYQDQNNTFFHFNNLCRTVLRFFANGRKSGSVRRRADRYALSARSGGVAKAAGKTARRDGSYLTSVNTFETAKILGLSGIFAKSSQTAVKKAFPAPPQRKNRLIGQPVFLLWLLLGRYLIALIR